VDCVLRAFATYAFVWLVFRVSGKRSLAEITAFDFVLLLIISETTQAALMDKDNSLTNSFLLIATMVGLDVALSLWKQRSPAVERVVDGMPLVILADGIPLKERMDKERIDAEDILAAARHLRGLERLDQIKYAVLERNGGITVIPKGPAAPAAAP
jgi:uncharacterized membrane protein YcaP (DUF421 family)